MNDIETQLCQQLTAQIEPQGWHLHRIQEESMNARHFYLGMYPEKTSDIHTIYSAAFANEQYPGFFHCCTIYVFKNGRALPLEWWLQRG